MTRSPLDVLMDLWRFSCQTVARSPLGLINIRPQPQTLYMEQKIKLNQARFSLL